MVQILVLSGLLIAVLIPVAALGLLGLGAGAAVHELAEIVVIGNGLPAGRNIYGKDHDHTTQAVPAPARDDTITDHTHMAVGW